MSQNGTLQERSRRTRRKKGIASSESMRRLSNKVRERKRSKEPFGPTAFGYGRISHYKQIEGDSIEGQKARIERFFEMTPTFDNCHWGGFWPEPDNVSASSVRFEQRPCGKSLIALLKSGDHLICDKIDRLWRSVPDFVKLMEYFKKENVTVHFVNQLGATIQTGTPMGDFFMTMMVAVAELESAQIGARNRAAYAHARDQGYWAHKMIPMGTHRVGQKRRYRLEWDWPMREWMADIVRRHDDLGQSFEEIAKHVKDTVLDADNGLERRFKSRDFWKPDRCKAVYVREHMYRMCENPNYVDYRQITKLIGKRDAPAAVREFLGIERECDQP